MNIALIISIFLFYMNSIHPTSVDIEEMFSLATSLYENDRNNTIDNMKAVQLIRIPKASSTSLSAVVRRLMGCHPPGPCCKFPGDPPGSCPQRGLFDCQLQFKVIGCTGHYVDYNQLLSKTMKTISIIREPRARSLSAFFYPGIHHNSECKAGIEECFQRYLVDIRFKNIATKMLTGDYSYAKTATCRNANDCHHSLESALLNMQQHLEFMGIAEMWELSLVVFHSKFPSLIPLLSEFRMTEGTSDAEKLGKNNPSIITNSSNSRVNRDSTYLDFKNLAFTTYKAELRTQSLLDLELYSAALHQLCAELHRLNLWKLKKVQRYWRSRSPEKVEQCR